MKGRANSYDKRNAAESDANSDRFRGTAQDGAQKRACTHPAQPRAYPKAGHCGDVAIVMAGAVGTVVGYIQVTDLTKKVEDKQAQLAQLESECTSLKAKKENSVDLSQVENYAENVLGLVKLDRSQEEYLGAAEKRSGTGKRGLERHRKTGIQFCKEL